MRLSARASLALLAAGLLGLAACSRTDPGGSKPVASPHADGVRAHGGKGDGSGEHRAEVRIYAAASLTDVITALAKRFEPIRGSRLVPSYGASNTLALQ